jgi:sortase A
VTTPSAVLRLPVPRRRRFPARPFAVAAGALAIVLVGSFIGSNVYASLAQRGLASRWDSAERRYEAMDPVARSAIAYRAGDPVARIQISSIRLDAIVLEGATPGAMRRGPAHLAGSATPGQDGVAVITANRFGFGGYFAKLGHLGIGDQIVVQSAIGTTTYTVIEARVVTADQLDLSTDSSQPVLVLFGNAHLWGGGDRLVVRATAGTV